jgi:8-oxo-dGTP diphosphatase
LHQQDGVHVVAAVLYRAEEVLIFRRGPGMTGAGHWEFPGGKVEAGEDAVSALKREILEEIGAAIEIESYIGETVHQYPVKKIRLNFYWAKAPPEPFHLAEHDAYRWVKPKELDVKILSEADRPIVEVLKNDSRMKV